MAIKIAGTDVIDNNRYATNIEGVELSAIAKDTGDTANDVFVYDTRKDSDGGAWRKRCQHTSWYNETLNTSTRGSRKEFPAVAVIVAKDNQLKIYDGDDPDMPMWMVFNEVSGSKDMIFRRTPTAISAMNGLICLAVDDPTVSGGYTGLGRYNFISDEVTHMNHAGVYTFPENISERESAAYLSSSTTDSNYWIASGGKLVGGYVHDVAMTVLPNAPIDDATGLPIPTIAAATVSGVSVIKDDGSVVDIISSYASSRKTEKVIFTDENGIGVFHTDQYNLRYTGWQWYSSIPSSDTTYTQGSSKTYGCSGVPSMSSDLTSTGPTSGFKADYGLNQFVLAPRNGYVDRGISIADHNPSNTDAALVSYITSSYNTGWMNGDIKLATLSDTDDTDVTGSELVTNGTFDSDISGWSASDAGCSLSLVSNQLRITNNDASAGGAVTSFSVVSGKTYTFSVGTSSKAVWLYLGDAPNNAAYFGPVVSNSHTWTSNTTGTVYFMVKNSVTTNGDTIDIDNISVRLAEEDRSVNGNGLQVFGTVTKNPVATGADLVAYSGFSSSNYLEQPYNSDLDFGTGDFCIMGWVKLVSSASFEPIAARLNSAATDGWNLSKSSDNTLYLYTKAGSVASNTPTTGYAAPTGSWVHFCCVRHSSGLMEMYYNGALKSSATATVRDVDVTDPLYVGEITGFTQADFGGSLALFRISATAPTAEQIAKIYEDEKVLFQENAQATLYGSSDAVTALAYDDDTNLLHVGTSSGRSDFNGLRRVNNTTTGVTTAISASNELIVEQ